MHFSGPYQTVTPVFEISSFKGTQQIRFIAPQLPFSLIIFYLKTKSEPDFET